MRGGDDEKNNMKGGLPRKGGLDSLQIQEYQK